MSTPLLRPRLPRHLTDEIRSRAASRGETCAAVVIDLLEQAIKPTATAPAAEIERRDGLFYATVGDKVLVSGPGYDRPGSSEYRLEAEGWRKPTGKEWEAIHAGIFAYEVKAHRAEREAADDARGAA